MGQSCIRSKQSRTATSASIVLMIVEDVKCPNCNQANISHDLAQDGFMEYRCNNKDCLVEVFRSEKQSE
jgi:transposase-like protein